MNRASETRGTQTFQYTQRRIPEGEEREKGVTKESDMTLRLKNNGEESAINLAEDLLYEMSCFSIISIFFFLF